MIVVKLHTTIANMVYILFRLLVLFISNAILFLLSWREPFTHFTLAEGDSNKTKNHEQVEIVKLWKQNSFQLP